MGEERFIGFHGLPCQKKTVETYSFSILDLMSCGKQDPGEKSQHQGRKGGAE